MTTILNNANNPLSISLNGRWILYTLIEQAGSDLMTVANYR